MTRAGCSDRQAGLTSVQIQRGATFLRKNRAFTGGVANGGSFDPKGIFILNLPFRYAERPPFLRGIARKRGPCETRPSRTQVSSRATGQMSAFEPRPISTSHQPVLPRIVRSAPSATISAQPEPSKKVP